MSATIQSRRLGLCPGPGETLDWVGLRGVTSGSLNSICIVKKEEEEER